MQMLDAVHRWITNFRHKPHLVLNVGGSNTADMTEFVRTLPEASYDALMVVTPPYLKPPIEGIIAHIRSLDFSGKSIMYYHIPGRCARSHDIHEVIGLFRSCQSLTAIKESSGSLDLLRRLSQAESQLEYEVTRYVGDDPLYLPALSESLTCGVVSVISNLIPKIWQDLKPQNLEINRRAMNAFGTLCRVPNPIGVKYALRRLGIIRSDTCRLPLLSFSQCLNAHRDIPPSVMDAAVDEFRSLI
jgi:4-hydroxy-tetrahydrodipicolinate synthase